MSKKGSRPNPSSASWDRRPAGSRPDHAGSASAPSCGCRAGTLFRCRNSAVLGRTGDHWSTKRCSGSPGSVTKSFGPAEGKSKPRRPVVLRVPPVPVSVRAWFSIGASSLPMKVGPISLRAASMATEPDRRRKSPVGGVAELGIADDRVGVAAEAECRQLLVVNVDCVIEEHVVLGHRVVLLTIEANRLDRAAVEDVVHRDPLDVREVIRRRAGDVKFRRVRVRKPAATL